jgi:hypothetical protein
MNKKAQLVERIKAQLKSLMEVKLAQHKAGDLIIITEEDMIGIDSEVYYQDEAGNNVALEDGEYTLDSGEVISVLNGKVVSIKKQEKVVEEVIEDIVEETEMQEEVVVEEKVDENGVVISDEFKKKLKDLEDKVEMLMKKFEDSEKEKEEMKSKLSEISEQPSVSKIEKKAVELSSDKTVVDFDFKAMREKIRKNQK